MGVRAHLDHPARDEDHGGAPSRSRQNRVKSPIVVAFTALEIARIAVDASAAPDHSHERKAVLAGVTVEDGPGNPCEARR